MRVLIEVDLGDEKICIVSETPIARTANGQVVIRGGIFERAVEDARGWIERRIPAKEKDA